MNTIQVTLRIIRQSWDRQRKNGFQSFLGSSRNFPVDLTEYLFSIHGNSFINVLPVTIWFHINEWFITRESNAETEIITQSRYKFCMSKTLKISKIESRKKHPIATYFFHYKLYFHFLDNGKSKTNSPEIL